MIPVARTSNERNALARAPKCPNASLELLSSWLAKAVFPFKLAVWASIPGSENVFNELNMVLLSPQEGA